MNTRKQYRSETGILTLIGLVFLGIGVYEVPTLFGAWAGVVCIALGLVALTISVRLLAKAISRKG